MESFDVYFLGEMLPDVDPAEVRDGVARLFKVGGDGVDRLFSGKPLRVKQGVDADTASRYRAAFREVGALVQIVVGGAPAPTAKAAAAKRPADGAPAAPTAAAAPDAIGDASLAEPGAIIDHTPPVPPADIDTSGLEALPANTGSLEDCHIEKPPHPIPDISHMKLVDD
ncbi:MAG: hypothetical protein H6953_10280 [Chromatiaceae bacterium]|nr:hypothetical protein [Gammaproteobacteria bacterium]MCP5305825.1 hypothetical protein [Chromatiaceae bacterium]MCP5312681.1 hypothetical protein [Chromatiaceae bacterium]